MILVHLMYKSKFKNFYENICGGHCSCGGSFLLQVKVLRYLEVNHKLQYRAKEEKKFETKR